MVSMPDFTYTTQNLQAFAPIKEYEPVNGFDPIKALNRCGRPQEDEPFDGEGLAELESFCQKHGILAANFGNMSPRAALKMLKVRVGKPITETCKRELLNG